MEVRGSGCGDCSTRMDICEQGEVHARRVWWCWHRVILGVLRHVTHWVALHSACDAAAPMRAMPLQLAAKGAAMAPSVRRAAARLVLSRVAEAYGRMLLEEGLFQAVRCPFSAASSARVLAASQHNVSALGSPVWLAMLHLAKACVSMLREEGQIQAVRRHILMSMGPRCHCNLTFE